MSDLSFPGTDAILPGDGTVAGFKAIEVWEAGGMTTVLRAQSAQGVDVALKVANKAVIRDPTVRGRFEREAEILRALRHPAFCELLAHGTYATSSIAEVPYIITELPKGRGLDRVLFENKNSGQPPNLQLAVRLLRNLAAALEFAHSRGIIHRNLKPNKIMVALDGLSVQITDFVLGLSTSGPRQLTRQGTFLGTPAYIAPEQAKDAHNVDGRADLYSLGLIVYEFCTHAHPFGTRPGSGMAEVVAHLTSEVRLPSTANPNIPPDLDAILFRMLRRNPDERFQTAQELLQALDRLTLSRS